MFWEWILMAALWVICGSGAYIVHRRAVELLIVAEADLIKAQVYFRPAIAKYLDDWTKVFGLERNP